MTTSQPPEEAAAMDEEDAVGEHAVDEDLPSEGPGAERPDLSRPPGQH